MKIKILKIILILFCTGLLTIVVAFGTYFYMLTPVNKSSDSSYRLKIKSGETLRTVADDLMQENLIRSDSIFYLYGRLNNIQLQAGIFTVSPAMSVQELSAMLESGQQEYIKVSIPEGLTISKIGQLLEENEVTSAADFIAVSKDPVLLAEFNIPAQNLEGYMFPETYNFDPEMPAEKVVRLMLNTFYSKIGEIETFQGLSSDEIHQTLILASIIEREYRVANEAPLIASVFENRLERDIGLYSCATIEYVITEIQGRPHPGIITIADTQIDSPYNTYKWAGLPPSPISNPGVTALSAAASPANTNYYYFRLIDPALGTHIFTSNFDDHIEAGFNTQTKNVPGQ